MNHLALLNPDSTANVTSQTTGGLRLLQLQFQIKDGFSTMHHNV